MTIVYRGFSTLQHQKKYGLTDFELARQDLLNYFQIRKGDKLMQPEFGTVIWDLLFEPLTEDIQTIITNDITRIVSYDPRLQAGQVSVLEQGNGFLIQITLAYVPTNQTATINLNFNRDSQNLNSTATLA
jgi:phage baseplate assembly protein W